jgi:hypothetical protein
LECVHISKLQGNKISFFNIDQLLRWLYRNRKEKKMNNPPSSRLWRDKNTKINYLSLLMISGLILSSTLQAMDVLTPHEKLEKLKESWGTNKEDAAAFRQMLENKEINPKTYNSLLIDAIKVYASKIVQLLLDAGANPNAIEKFTIHGDHPSNARRIANYVLSLAVDPRLGKKDFYTYNPTQFSGRIIKPSYAPAIKAYQEQIVQNLLSKGANPNISDGEVNNQKSPLVRAVALGESNIVLMLIEAGADIQEAFIHFGITEHYEFGKRLIDMILNAPASKAITTFVGIGTKKRSPYLKGHGRDIPVLIGQTMKKMTKVPNREQLLHLLSPGETLKKTNFPPNLESANAWYRYVQDFNKTK